MVNFSHAVIRAAYWILLNVVRQFVICCIVLALTHPLNQNCTHDVWHRAAFQTVRASQCPPVPAPADCHRRIPCTVPSHLPDRTCESQTPDCSGQQSYRFASGLIKKSWFKINLNLKQVATKRRININGREDMTVIYPKSTSSEHRLFIWKTLMISKYSPHELNCRTIYTYIIFCMCNPIFGEPNCLPPFCCLQQNTYRFSPVESPWSDRGAAHRIRIAYCKRGNRWLAVCRLSSQSRRQGLSGATFDACETWHRPGGDRRRGAVRARSSWRSCRGRHVCNVFLFCCSLMGNKEINQKMLLLLLLLLGRGPILFFLTLFARQNTRWNI